MSQKEQAHERRLEKLARECGSVMGNALRDPSVIEVMLNPDGKLWIDQLGVGMSYTGHIIETSQAESILSTCASILNTAITYDTPILEGEFPLDESRLEGLISPIVRKPTFAIRKPASRVFTLEDYVSAGIIKPLSKVVRAHHAIDAFNSGFKTPLDAIRKAISLRKNILIVGGTSSGKTTLTNAILHEISLLCPKDRVVVIQDTNELQVNIENTVLLKTSETVKMPRLLKATMRLRPDRIVVGEVRGGEVETLLKAWNSGHPGGTTTVHADTAEKGLKKLVEYSTEVENPAPHHVLCERVAEAVNLVLFIESIDVKPGRQVAEISVVKEFRDGKFYLEPIKEI